MVNKITKFILRLSLLLSSFFWRQAEAQQIDLNNIALLDVNRVQALLDTSSTTNSFTIRNSSIQFNPKLKSWRKVFVNHLSAMSVLQENSNLPFGFNDGSMIPSVGKQHYYNFQIGVQWGNFTLQFAPEKVNAENFEVQGLGNDFDGSANGSPGNFWRRYYEISENIIEAPNTHFNKKSDENFIGQTSIKYHTKNISFGIST